MSALTLREIGKNSFEVSDDSCVIGDIKLASEAIGEIWLWSITVDPSDPLHGKAADLEQAMWEFRQLWVTTKARIGSERLALLAASGKLRDGK